MMYQSPTRHNFRAGVAVAAVQVGIGAALLSGFAGGVIQKVIHPQPHRYTPSWTYVPPPPVPPGPAHHAAAPTRDTITAPQTAIPDLAPTGDLTVGPLLPLAPFTGSGVNTLSDFPLPKPTPTFTPIAARPLGDRGAWITTDDYPSRALREGWSGVTRLHVLVGSDGRVEGCTVTASSGHVELDSVACTKVTERARFTPARDSSGAVGAGTYDGAIRWKINEVPTD